MGFQSELLEQLNNQYSCAGNHKDAIAMQAYQKDISKFMGIRTPERRAINKVIFSALPIPTSAQLATSARALWKLDFQLHQYIN
jgi:3-methyladenine DNA glycosylase AlkD